MTQNEIKAEDLRYTWRLLTGVVIFQLVGALCGYIIKFHPTQFVSIWIGAAFSTFIGFCFGVWWHFKDHSRRKKIPYFTLFFTGFVSLFLGGFSTMILFGYIKF